jgi:hypothetical protein
MVWPGAGMQIERTAADAIAANLWIVIFMLITAP